MEGSLSNLKPLLFVAVLLILAEPGRVPLFEPDEGRYAEIPREMLATGDFVTPRLDGAIYFEKPPLHYWTVAASFALLGQSELAARVPTKLASVGLVLLTFFFARRRYGERTALLSALIVASSPMVFALARINLIDPSVSCALAAAVFAFAAFQEAEGRGDARTARRALFGLHASCAIAVMLKGLIGIVLPGGAIFLWVLVTGRWRVLPKLFAPAPLLLFLALSVPWHVLVAQRNPDFLSFYFVHEHLDRFATSEARRGGSPLYFVAVLLGGFLPWTGFFGRLRWAWPGRTLEAWRSRPTEAYLWIFAIQTFLFFSVSKSKLIPYLEPIWPAVAVLLAVGIERARQARRSLSGDRRVAAFFFGLLFAAGCAFGIGGGFVKELGIGVAAAVILGGLFLAFLLNVAPFAARGDFVPWVAAPWLVFHLGGVLALPGVARAITPWPLVSALERELRPGDLVVQYGHYVQVVPFYLKELTPVSGLGWHELDFGKAHDHAPGLFPTEEEFARLWNGPRRVLAVVHADHLRRFGDPTRGLAPPLILARERNAKHYVVANRPPPTPGGPARP